MKRIRIILLISIAVSVAVLISFMGNLTTYDTVVSARQKEGKYVHLIARIDKSKPIQFDPVKNPNYLSFTAIDTLGYSTKVVYLKGKPADLETAERLVLKGSMKNGNFECKEILLKCPSKYKDDPKIAHKNLEKSSY